MIRTGDPPSPAPIKGINKNLANRARSPALLNRVPVRRNHPPIHDDHGGFKFEKAYALNRDLSVRQRDGIARCILNHHSFFLRLNCQWRPPFV